MGAVAEFERDLIRERTRAGMASARRRGSRIGRPRVHVPTAKARQLLAQGLSQREVAGRLELSRSTLRKALDGKGRSNGARDPSTLLAENQPSEVGI